MSSELAKAEIISEDQIELIKNTICKGASDDELQLFVATANRLRLDPFARQVFAVKRWDGKLRREVMTIQVSIDGFRLVAERTGQYRGQTEPQWCGADGQWRNVWLDDKPPAAARCGVFRDGFSEPLYAIARWRDYVQTTKEGRPNRMWQQFGPTMLHKCCESLALRKAFPMELSGVYSTDEMGQAVNQRPLVQEVEATPLLAPAPDNDADGVFMISWGPYQNTPITKVPGEWLVSQYLVLSGRETRTNQADIVMETFYAELVRRYPYGDKPVTDPEIPRSKLHALYGAIEKANKPEDKVRKALVWMEIERRRAAEAAQEAEIDAAEREAIEAEEAGQ